MIAPGGVFLMELKDWHGSLESRNGSAAPHDTEGAPHFEQRRIDAPGRAGSLRPWTGSGIARSDAQYKVGPHLLNRKSFGSGPTWADPLARRSDLPEAGPDPVYLRERGSDAELRASVERTARREAAVLRRFRHPGVVQLTRYDPSGHSAGPALIFCGSC